MTRKDKLLQKIKNNPRSASFGDVRQLLMDVGFAERQPKSGSSHHIYYHTALEQVVVLVKGHDPLPEYQVNDALRALSLLGGASGKD
jgi:predicted RNA binding protein YcfA (HicA-like mRNA interferase family)